jgi:hypothetical protein
MARITPIPENEIGKKMPLWSEIKTKHIPVRRGRSSGIRALRNNESEDGRKEEELKETLNTSRSNPA